MTNMFVFPTKESAVRFVDGLLSQDGNFALTLTIERRHRGDYSVRLVTEDSDGTSLPNGSEQQQTTSTTPRCRECGNLPNNPGQDCDSDFHTSKTHHLENWDNEGGYFGGR